MRLIRSITVAAALLLTGSAFAYDTFTVGLHAEFHPEHVGYNAHLVLPLFDVSGARKFSVRLDFAAGDVAYAGAAALLSGAGPGLQPFASLGVGAALWGSVPPRTTLQGLLGVRIPLSSHLYVVPHYQLRVLARGWAALPGIGIGFEYSF